MHYSAFNMVSVRITIAMKKHHDHGNSDNRKHLFGAGLQLAHYHHSGRHGVMQADMVLDR